jgi:MerR family transcriptional regulator/heat shock protein HspR
VWREEAIVVSETRGRRSERRTDAAEERAVYIISVAAELSGVHPQTLRMYERRGLLAPKRTSGNTRRYSERDIARIQMIQELTQRDGVSLAGVKLFIEMREQLAEMRKRTQQLERELLEQMRRRSPGAEIVPLRSLRTYVWEPEDEEKDAVT